MRRITISSMWLSLFAVITALVSCNTVSSVDYTVLNLTEDTVTVSMYKEILTSDYQGYVIEEGDSVIVRYGENDSITVAVLKPKQALQVHNDWDGLYREERIVPLWKYIKTITVGDTERAADTWDNESTWYLKKSGGGRFEDESRHYFLYIRNK